MIENMGDTNALQSRLTYCIFGLCAQKWAAQNILFTVLDYGTLLSLNRVAGSDGYRKEWERGSCCAETLAEKLSLKPQTERVVVEHVLGLEVSANGQL